MVQVIGKYVHEKSENLDEYFKAVGVPYIARKMMGVSNPTLEISMDEQGEWTIKVTTLFRTLVTKFKSGEEYEEHMPGAVIKSTTTIEDDKIITKSTSPLNNSHTKRVYEFTDTECIIKYKHEETGKEATRYFRRVE